jgi:hypothetical protein
MRTRECSRGNEAGVGQHATPSIGIGDHHTLHGHTVHTSRHDRVHRHPQSGSVGRMRCVVAQYGSLTFIAVSAVENRLELLAYAASLLSTFGCVAPGKDGYLWQSAGSVGVSG